MSNPTIWWIRRDLRLTDNPALGAAIASSRQVIPCFIIDPKLLNSSRAGQKRNEFLFQGLRSLDADLRARGSRLVLRLGEPVDELARLQQESGAGAIFAEEDFTPYAQRRDQTVAATLPLRLVGTPTVHHPTQTLKPNGAPYTVFTPFKKAWLAHPRPAALDLPPAPTQLSTPLGLTSLDLPLSRPSDKFPAGEAEARQRLERFICGPINRYADERNRLDHNGTSQLSPYLRFGMLSARQALIAASAALAIAPDAESRQGVQTWISELIWREFYASILFYFPDVLGESFRPAYRDLPWSHDVEVYKAWCDGYTGYPVVDAAMRQLAATGWMHNRARMIVASFLVKDLLIDWRWGERWFMQHLIDGDPAANNGGWQWTAGVGTDAAPYFRIFNPVTQGKKFDPEGRFVRRWLPALASVPDKYIHAPWEMPATVQAQAGCHIGQEYPAPIIDHAFARQRALDAYAQVRAEGDA